jgi:hypothetical protein
VRLALSGATHRYRNVAVVGRFLRGSLGVHQVLIGIAAPVSLWAVVRSKLWMQYQVGAPMLAGLLLLALAAFYKPAEALEAPISIVGAALLAFGHYRNTRLVHSQKQAAQPMRIAA